MADTIGTAYVQIEPSFEGVTPKIESHFSGEGEKSGKSFASGFGSVMGTVGKAMAGAAAAGAAAVAGVAKSAVSAYSDFEQLAGGTELLFGRTAEETEAIRKSMLDSGMSARQVAEEMANMSDASDTVMQNAQTAFSRVQMSMNDYLQTANSYATGLKESLGGDAEAAAELTDKIITAQADIVAATGNDAESVANAFAGIMKSNFSMLDNLQLGIKPTKEGMQEVIDKMNELIGTKYEMGNLAVMQAAIVDYVDYVGMAGYAHNEAAGTIQGSLASTKAAWENLMTSLGTGDENGISTAIDNLVTTASQLGTNIMPIVQNALAGISQLISELAPQIAAALPDLISQVLPGLLDAGVDIIKALGKGILEAIPDLMPAITDVIMELCDMLVEMLPQLIEVGLQVILQLALGIAQALPELIPAIVDTVLTIAEYLIDNVDLLIDASIALIMGLAEGLINALPKLIEKAPEIVIKLVEAIIRNVPKILQAGIELILMLIKGIVDSWSKVFEVGKQIVEKVKNGFSDKVQEAKEWGKDMIQNFIDGIMAKWNALKESVSKVADTVKSFLGFSEPEEGPLSNFHTFAPDMMDLFAKGITDNIGTVKSALTDAASGIMGSGLDLNTIQSVQTDINPSGVAQNEDRLNRIESLLAEFLPNINQNIYLDTGALVGATAGAYNVALGQIATRGGRR